MNVVVGIMVHAAMQVRASCMLLFAVPFASFSAYLGTPFRVLFICGHGRVLGFSNIDIVRQPSLFLDLRLSPLRSGQQRLSLLGYARAPSLASVHQYSPGSQLVQIRCGMRLHAPRGVHLLQSTSRGRRGNGLNAPTTGFYKADVNKCQC